MTFKILSLRAFAWRSARFKCFSTRVSLSSSSGGQAWLLLKSQAHPVCAMQRLASAQRQRHNISRSALNSGGRWAHADPRTHGSLLTFRRPLPAAHLISSPLLSPTLVAVCPLVSRGSDA